MTTGAGTKNILGIYLLAAQTHRVFLLFSFSIFFRFHRNKVIFLKGLALRYFGGGFVADIFRIGSDLNYQD